MLGAGSSRPARDRSAISRARVGSTAPILRAHRGHEPGGLRLNRATRRKPWSRPRENTILSVGGRASLTQPVREMGDAAFGFVFPEDRMPRVRYPDPVLSGIA